jgi:hypothetical protein
VDPAARPDVTSVVAGRFAEVAGRPAAREVAQLVLATPEMDRPTRDLAAATVRVPVIPRQRGRSYLLRWLRK